VNTKLLVDFLQTVNIRALAKRITKLEENMARLDDVIAQINDATNAIAAELDDLRSQLATGDSAAADKLQPIADRLRAMAADPDNVVPPAEPTSVPAEG